MNELTDPQLLRTYAEKRSEPAFAELVRRHLDFVYSAALRMVCDAHLAQDVTQGVFLALAKNADRLKDRTVLSGWLHLTARNIASQTVRTEVRRREREQKATFMNESNATDSESSWENIAPQLDEALGELDELDRDVLLLRYFERKSSREMAQVLGISDDAAKKRVSRAVDRIRALFTKRGVAVSGGSLALALSAHAVQAAPAGLGLTISATLLSGTAASTTILSTTKVITMTALQKTLIAATVAVLTSAGIYEANRASRLQQEVRSLQQERTTLAGQIQRVETEREDAKNQTELLAQEVSELKSGASNLAALRAEATRLHADADLVNDPFVKTALEWKRKKDRLQQLFAERPEQRVPEMQFLTEQVWLDIARDENFDSEEDIRKALSAARHVAKNTFAPMLQYALKAFIEANGKRLPDAMTDLKPYFEKPVDDALLGQYQLLFSGTMKDVRGNYVVKDRQLIDPEYDDAWSVGPYAYGPDSSEKETAQLQNLVKTLDPVFKAYSDSTGTPPERFDQLRPYLTTPDQRAAYEKLAKTGFVMAPPK